MTSSMDAFGASNLLLFCLHIQDVLCSELDLYNKLFDPTKYSSDVRPRKHPNEKVDVHVELELNFIGALDASIQVLHTNGFMVAEWHDDHLKWNPDDYDHIEKFIVPPEDVWLPDFAVVNSAGAVYDKMHSSHFRIHVESDGSVVWLFGGNFQTTCQLDLTYFPFDEQKCDFIIENWAYPSAQVDLFNSTSKVMKDDFHENGEWDFVHSTVEKEYVEHDVFQDTKFPKITFSMYLQRKPGYYLLNIVTPCFMLVILALFVYWLPADSGEKISLGITVLLALSVFQLIIAENVPKTSDFTPLLSVYVAFVMGISCASTTLAIFTMYLHFKVTDKRPPKILKVIFFKFFARVFCMTAPDCATNRGAPAPTPSDEGNTLKAFKNGGIVGEIKLEDFDAKKKPAPPDEVTRYLCNIAAYIDYSRDKMKAEEHAEEIREEWQALARIIDRTSFWITLVIIVVVCCHLFIGSSINNVKH